MEAVAYRVRTAQEEEDAEVKAFIWKTGTVITLGVVGLGTCFYALVVSNGTACLVGFGMMALSFVLTIYWLYKATGG